jgi:hypothetical protein
VNVDDQHTRRLAENEKLAANEFEVYEDAMRDACEAKVEDDEIEQRDEHVRDSTARLEALVPAEVRRPPVSPGLIRQRMANVHRGRR